MFPALQPRKHYGGCDVATCMTMYRCGDGPQLLGSHLLEGGEPGLGVV